MNYAVEMGLGVHTKFHNDWFRHSKVVRGGYTHGHTDTQTARRFHKPTFIFWEKESTLNMTGKQQEVTFCLFEIFESLLISLKLLGGGGVLIHMPNFSNMWSKVHKETKTLVNHSCDIFLERL
jgi:hypothetical protein